MHCYRPLQVYQVNMLEISDHNQIIPTAAKEFLYGLFMVLNERRFMSRPEHAGGFHHGEVMSVVKWESFIQGSLELLVLLSLVCLCNLLTKCSQDLRALFYPGGRQFSHLLFIYIFIYYRMYTV